MEIAGFRPGEDIGFWLTGPNNQVGGAEQTVVAAGDGRVTNLSYSTRPLSPGRWYWVFQGRQSGHQSILFFHVYQP